MKSKPNWGPLATYAARIPMSQWLFQWMWMYSKDGHEYYKHVNTRQYLVLDANGQPVQGKGNGDNAGGVGGAL